MKAENHSYAGGSVTDLPRGVQWFTRCDFTGSDLRQATFDDCFFFFCDFRRAQLTGASLRRAHMAACDFTDADLRFVDLTGATLTYVNTGSDNGRTVMTGADLTGATVKHVTADRVVDWSDGD